MIALRHAGPGGTLLVGNPVYEVSKGLLNRTSGIRHYRNSGLGCGKTYFLLS